VVVFSATVLVWMNCFLPETGVAKLRLSTHPVYVERNQDLLFLLEISASIFPGCRTPVYIPDGRLENVFRLVSMVVLLPIHWEVVQSICLDGGAFMFLFTFHTSLVRTIEFLYTEYTRSGCDEIFWAEQACGFLSGIYTEFSFVFFWLQTPT